ncbi:MAG: KpsF/GutQ family sugar-phosphate isomerase [Desulfobacterales bacterium]|nr:KpsF/GutQ family sugar-phosphate isomerase [Desulfobacterales bacterium]
MLIKEAIEVLKIEAEGILNLIDRVDHNFVDMVELICNSKGRVIISGMGKSGIIGQKIVATLNSTGTRALSLHPVEALHGDLGIVSRNDVFIAISNSGEAEELNDLIPLIRNIGCKVISFTGKTESTQARLSDIVIDVGVEREACPLGLAPTASTTAVLAMGDALAVALINKKQFTSKDFKKFHPGGALGKRLSSKVSDIMVTGDKIPVALEGILMKEAIKKINHFDLGALFITQEDTTLLGIITDGDLRRVILAKGAILELYVDEVMIKNPKTVTMDMPVYDALNIMEHYEITVLPVVDQNGRVKGILHLHDILGKGAFKFNGT